MLTAIYARKSTDQNGVSDEEKSVTRQVDHSKDYALKKGWTVAEEHIYVDDGISGAEFVKRPGFLRLMNTLKPKAAFQVLIMSEESRLGREQIETAYALKQLITAGVRVFFYLEDRERKLETPTDKIMLSLTNFAAEMEREKARQRTSDAMMRLARAGYVTGGLVYGYENVDIFMAGQEKRSHVERRINPEQAAVVRLMFRLCATGKGLRGIAKHLNATGTPPPRATNRVGQGWDPSAVRSVLYRELYKGEIVWNKSKKRNTWGQYEPKRRPEHEWVRLPKRVEHLRIVTDEEWNAAHERLAATRATYLRQTNGQLWGRPSSGLEAKHLLSGFTSCALCGSSLYARSRAHGQQRAWFYVCVGASVRGTCDNRLPVPLETADRAVLDTLAGELLHPEVVLEAVRQAVARLRPSQEECAAQQRQLAAERDAVTAELARLAQAIATGGDLPVLLAAVKEREQRRAELERQLAMLEGCDRVVELDEARLERDLRGRLTDWQGLLHRQLPVARQMLRKLMVGRLVFTPDPATRTYSFAGKATFDSLLTGIVLTKVLVSPTRYARG